MNTALAILLSLPIVATACGVQTDGTASVKTALSSTVGWSAADGGYVNQDQVDGAAVGVHIRSYAPVNGGHLATITRDQADMRAAANAQNGPGVIGLRIGVEGTAQDPVWVDTGMSPTVDGAGGMAKFMGISLFTPYVYWNGHGSLNSSGPFVAVGAPHTGIGSDGAVCLPWVATYWTDGAPDINPDLTVDTSLPGEGSYAFRANGDAVYFGGSLVWGQPENGGSNYEDCASGATAGVAGAGHIRRGCNTTAGVMGFDVTVDGDPHWQPLPVAMQGFKNWGTGYGQATTAYAPGETTIKSWLPNDAKGSGDHGLRSMDPHLWNLPPVQTVSGGTVKACLRFVVASGSSQIFCNTTGVAKKSGRNDDFFAFAGTWITETRVAVVNTSGTTTAPLDIGLIQYEWTSF